MQIRADPDLQHCFTVILLVLVLAVLRIRIHVFSPDPDPYQNLAESVTRIRICTSIK